MNTHLIWHGIRLDRINPQKPGFYLWASGEHSHVAAITVSDPKTWKTMPGFFCPLVPDPANVVEQPDHSADMHAKPKRNG